MLYFKNPPDNKNILFSKILKYGLTGTFGMGIDFFTTWSLITLFSCNRFFANSTGFIFAATANYIINSAWTFRDSKIRKGRGFVSFFIVSLVGLGINYLSMVFLMSLVPTAFYICKLVSIVIVFFWNFLANSLFTFRPEIPLERQA